MRLIVGLISFLVYSSAQADEWIVDGIDPQSPSGMVQVVPAGAGTGAYVKVGDQAFLEGEAFRFVAVIHQYGARYLGIAAPMGDDCEAVYFWIETADPSVQKFGNCGRAYQFGLDVSEPMVILPRPDETGFDGFRYDGQQIERVDLGLYPSGFGPDPVQWVGRSLRGFLVAPERQQMFLTYMPIEAYLGLTEWFRQDAVFRLHADWVSAGYCHAISCELDLTGVYVHRSGEAMFVVLNGGQVLGGEVWGDAGGHEAPRLVQRILRFQ